MARLSAAARGVTGLALILLALAGCGPQTGSAGPLCKDCNVVLILVDTLRADHLGVYGYPRATSPNLDALAAESVVFENARSQAACTFPSVNSLLTSRHPSRFVAGDAGLAIPEGVSSLAEVLSDAGYETLAVSASPIVRATPSDFNEQGGFGRGFDVFDESCEWRKAACVLKRAQALAAGLDGERPFFAYLHYMDPHSLYRPTKDHRFRFVQPYEGPEFIARGDPDPIAAARYGDGPEVEVSERDWRHLIDLYDEAISFFDDRLPAVLTAFESAAGERETIFVVVSDHGEAFDDHGHVKHCHSLYDSEIRTPLILHVPGGPSGLAIGNPVGNLDVAPSILDLLGLAASAPGFEGESLVPLLSGSGSSNRSVFSQQGTVRSIVSGRHKLLLELRRGRVELFDVTADPAEQFDVFERRPGVAGDLRERLDEHLLEVEGATSLEERLKAADEAERRLKAVGYLD